MAEVRCPICNTPNEPDTASCRQCGYGFTIAGTTWPEPPTIDFSEPTFSPEWPESPQIEVSRIDFEAATVEPPRPVEVSFPPTLPDPTPTMQVQPDPRAVQVEVPPAVEPEWPEQKDEVIEIGEERIAMPEVTPGQLSDDQQVIMHATRARDALRRGQIDVAIEEFKQAREVAQQADISRIAERHLERVTQRMEQALQERPEAVRSAPAAAPSPPRPTPIPSPAIPARGTSSVGVSMAIVNVLVTAFGSVLCVGFLSAPILGFMAGQRTARQVAQSGRLAALRDATIAGLLVGLGGWLGHTLGWPIARGLTGGEGTIVSNAVSACMMGLFFVPLGGFLGFIGGTSTLKF